MRELTRVVLLVCSMVGCLYDGDARCDPGQILTDDGYCVCAQGSVLEGNRCVACAQGQVVTSGRCACPAGTLLREGACVADADSDAGDAAPTGQGLACTADGGECAGKDADYCEAKLLKQCLVRDCKVGGDDCSAGWTCCSIAMVGKTLCLEEARLMSELGSTSCPNL